MISSLIKAFSRDDESSSSSQSSVETDGIKELKTSCMESYDVNSPEDYSVCVNSTASVVWERENERQRIKAELRADHWVTKVETTKGSYTLCSHLSREAAFEHVYRIMGVGDAEEYVGEVSDNEKGKKKHTPPKAENEETDEETEETDLDNRQKRTEDQNQVSFEDTQDRVEDILQDTDVQEAIDSFKD